MVQGLRPGFGTNGRLALVLGRLGTTPLGFCRSDTTTAMSDFGERLCLRQSFRRRASGAGPGQSLLRAHRHQDRRQRYGHHCCCRARHAVVDDPTVVPAMVIVLVQALNSDALESVFNASQHFLKLLSNVLRAQRRLRCLAVLPLARPFPFRS